MLRMYNYGDDREVPGWILRYLLKRETMSRTGQTNCSSVHATEMSDPHQKEHACTCGLESKSIKNGSIHHDDFTSNFPVEQEPLGNADLWKQTAMFIESKVSILLLLVILGNVLYSTLQICTRSLT